MAENDTPEDEAQQFRSLTLDSGALKALAHPLRVRILDLISTRGPQTASSLAALLGETSGATSYHLRALAAHDLIHEVADRGTARERWWERPSRRLVIPGPQDAQSEAQRAVTQVITSEFLRVRQEALMEFVNRPAVPVGDPWRDIGMVNTVHLDLTAAQVQELGEEISALVDRAQDRYRGQRGPDVRRVSVRCDVFDLPQPTERRATGEES